ncbi:MAG: hypothetical protein QOJ01_1750 [Solirubrobacterales bacterium]|nr:hypothetical protein [Solirubrobacterales bacterium]
METGRSIRNKPRASTRRVCLALAVFGLALVALAAVLLVDKRAERDGTATAASFPAAKAAPAAARSGPRSTRLAVRPPAGASAALFVKNGHHVPVRTAPAGGSLVKDVGRATAWGSRTTFSVVAVRAGWAQVVTPYLPNGQYGWVKLDRRRLGEYADYWAIDVDLSARRATVLRAGRPFRSFPVSIGAPGTDTPVGRFALTDTFRGQLASWYGCCALALSAHQPNVPSGWLGGNRIAIHGTFEPVGYAISHGCVRAANADVSALVSHVPVGTPVVIHE